MSVIKEHNRYKIWNQTNIYREFNKSEAKVPIFFVKHSWVFRYMRIYNSSKGKFVENWKFHFPQQ